MESILCSHSFPLPLPPLTTSERSSSSNLRFREQAMALFRPGGRTSSEEPDNSQTSPAEPEAARSSEDVERGAHGSSTASPDEAGRPRVGADSGGPDMGAELGDAQMEDARDSRPDPFGNEAQDVEQAHSKTGTWTSQLWESAEVLGHKLAEWERKLHPGTETGDQTPETLTPLGDQFSASGFAPLGSGPLILQEGLQHVVQSFEDGPRGIDARDASNQKGEQSDWAEARRGVEGSNPRADAKRNPSGERTVQGSLAEHEDRTASPDPKHVVLQASEGPIRAPAAPSTVGPSMGFGLAAAHLGGPFTDPQRLSSGSGGSQTDRQAPAAVQPSGEVKSRGNDAGSLPDSSATEASTAWHPLGAQVPQDTDATPLDLGSPTAEDLWTRIGGDPVAASPTAPVALQSPFGFGLATTESETVQLPQDAGLYSPFGTVVSDILHSTSPRDAPVPGGSPETPGEVADPRLVDNGPALAAHDGNDAAAITARRPQTSAVPDGGHGPSGSPSMAAQVRAEADAPSDATQRSALGVSPDARVPVPLGTPEDVEFEGQAGGPQRAVQGSGPPPPSPVTPANQPLVQQRDSTDNSLKVFHFFFTPEAIPCGYC